MTNNLTQALALAGDGIPVFPCAPGSKAPLVPTGFHAATISRKQIETWWTENPDALIGVPTGEVSGLDVLDVDKRNGGDAWLRENAERLKGSCVHRTRSGGVHILFRHADGLRSSASKVAPGVDIRADGGYVVWWPAHGYNVSGEATQPWPDQLLAAVRAGQTKVQDHCRDPAEIAPPSAEAVIDLLNRLPNPLHVDRDAYMAVMLAAQGSIRGLEAVGQDADGIAEAAIAWAERWDGYDGADEAAKWDADWSTRDAPLAGWQTLERMAARLMPEYRLEQAQAEFAAIPLDDAPDALLDALDAQTWAALDLPPTKHYLGWLLQTATKLNLIGATGLGKSQLSHAMATGIASGAGFGPWKTDAPSRVLVMDGEMSTRLVKARIGSAVKRHEHPIARGNLIVYALDREEHFAKAHPGLGRFHPLNTPDGLAFMKRLVQRTQPEVIFFDNTMSLMTGDQREETTWSGALGLMSWLSSQRIAQVWLDHTGHGVNRQYGSSTKMWRADAVGVMAPVDKAEVAIGQVRFTLTFNAPVGKARERDGDNYADFADRTFTMDASGWTVSGPIKAGAKLEGKQPKPQAMLWYGALQAVCVKGKADRAAWFEEGVSRGLTDPITPGMSKDRKDKRTGPLRNALDDLQGLGWVKCENVTTIYDLRGEASDDLAALAG